MHLLRLMRQAGHHKSLSVKTCGVSVFFSQVDNQKDCLDLCKSRPDCTWFTYSAKRRFCHLFENCPILDLEICPDCMSGDKNCLETEPNCGIRGECKGIIIEHQETSMASDDECLTLCHNTSGCGWFTFYQDTSQCILFETCSIVFCDTCISGEKICFNWKAVKGWVIFSCLKMYIYSRVPSTCQDGY